ncbi:hypothetical protein OHT57_05385 [Streptomyces sp. NBC_00285]|nr:hypothetical protein [Streptomyces sp. NBC_00285]
MDSTPPAAARTVGCTSTAAPSSGGVPSDGRSDCAWRAESSTARTASWNASQPRTSGTGRKRPVEDSSVSSCAEEELTTRASAMSSRTCHTPRTASAPAGAPGARSAGTRTNPGSLSPVIPIA